MLRRALVLAYGCFAYLGFLAIIVYACGFIGNLGTPTALDGVPEGSVAVALAVDLGLLALFALQHSGMARPAFKRWLTRWMPQAMERSTYVLLSCVAMALLFWQWRPLGGVIWEVTNPIGVGVLHSIFALGWVTVLITTFLIHHFDLFGLRQVWLEFRGQPYTPLRFSTPGPYSVVRHPLYVGWILTFWATPTMTGAHLVFALMTTLYILIAIRWEERDLIDAHPEYQAYRRRVPMLLPRLRIGETGSAHA